MANESAPQNRPPVHPGLSGFREALAGVERPDFTTTPGAPRIDHEVEAPAEQVPEHPGIAAARAAIKAAKAETPKPIKPIKLGDAEPVIDTASLRAPSLKANRQNGMGAWEINQAERKRNGRNRAPRTTTTQRRNNRKPL